MHCTYIEPGSIDWQQLADAGGSEVRLYAFPKDLPRYAYTGKNRWLELSRQKLDLVERHLKSHGHKVIWTDLDTVVLADLSCAYAQLENFVISRVSSGHTILNAARKPLKLRLGYSVYGDLWMADLKLIGQVRRLEASDLPPPPFDLQDYYTILLNGCSGVVTDLRGFLHDHSAQPMCFGFDFSAGHHPNPEDVLPMRVVNNTLHCTVHRNGRFDYYPIASLSFTFPLMRQFLQHPRELFRSPQLFAWARSRGFRAGD